MSKDIGSLRRATVIVVVISDVLAVLSALAFRSQVVTLSFTLVVALSFTLVVLFLPSSLSFALSFPFSLSFTFTLSFSVCYGKR